jgi:hypothetical protein
VAPLTFVYIAVRGAWLSSGLCGAGALVELVRTAIAGESTSASLLALGASVLFFAATSVLTRALGLPAARQAVAVIESGSGTGR